MEASYHPIAVPAFGPSCPARIWDVSLGGMALIVPHSYEAGAVLSVVPEVLPESLSPALEARRAPRHAARRRPVDGRL